MMRFSSDEYHRISNRLSMVYKQLLAPSHINKNDHGKTYIYNYAEMKDFSEAVESGLDFMGYLAHHIEKQFENGSTRKTCPNKDCHTIYAFFYENFKYCPYCGSELVVTPGYPEELNDIFIPIRNGSPAWYRSPKDAAKELNIGETTIRQWIRRGKIPDALKIGREVWVPNWWICDKKFGEE